MLLWPYVDLPPMRARWALAGQVVTGGTPLAGPPQTADLSCGGWWTCRLSLSTLRTLDQHRALRSMLAQLRGGSAQIVVPMLDALQPWVAGALGPRRPLPLSGLTAFDPTVLSGNAQILATLSHDAYAPAYPAPPAPPTQLKIAVTRGAALRPGTALTLIGGSTQPRLHMIAGVDDVTGGVTTCSVYPPLREDYAAGQVVLFDRPACLMKLDAGTAMDAWPEPGAAFVAEGPQIGFTETFPEAS